MELNGTRGDVRRRRRGRRALLPAQLKPGFIRYFYNSPKRATSERAVTSAVDSTGKHLPFELPHGRWGETGRREAGETQAGRVRWGGCGGGGGGQK